MKNSNGNIGNLNRDLPLCSTVEGPVKNQKSIVQAEDTNENYNKKE
jgi:hypothetical protein